jgi:hypothetical protein
MISGLWPYRQSARSWSPNKGVWMVWWMKWQIFIPILLLQFLNLFWYFLIWRILWRYVIFRTVQFDLGAHIRGTGLPRTTRLRTNALMTRTRTTSLLSRRRNAPESSGSLLKCLEEHFTVEHILTIILFAASAVGPPLNHRLSTRIIP